MICTSHSPCALGHPTSCVPCAFTPLSLAVRPLTPYKLCAMCIPTHHKLTLHYKAHLSNPSNPSNPPNSYSDTPSDTLKGCVASNTLQSTHLKYRGATLNTRTPPPDLAPFWKVVDVDL